MEYNDDATPIAYLPDPPGYLEIKEGKIWLNKRPGLGVEVDFKSRRQTLDVTTGNAERGQYDMRADRSFTNGQAPRRG